MINRLTKMAGLGTCVVVLVIACALAARFQSGDPSKSPTPKPRPVDADLDVLAGLPYVDDVIESETSKTIRGVTTHDREKAEPGINMYNNHRIAPGSALLLDMQGEILHRWQNGSEKFGWRFAEMNHDGSIVVMLRNRAPGLIKLDWKSNLVFALDGYFHHDAAFLPDGGVYALRQEVDELDYHGENIKFLHDSIVQVSNTGEIVKRIPLYPLFKDSLKAQKLLMRAASRPQRTRNVDLFHTNTVELIDRDIPGVCNKGNLLICVRNLDTVAVIDVDIPKVVWSWGHDDLDRPHMPTFLNDDRILIFDNGWQTFQSRVIELDPVTRSIPWQYRDGNNFFTQERGGSQRLPGGNTLVTVSDKGRVFEVTRNGNIVWEWFNPTFNHKNERGCVYRMTRYPKDHFDGLEFNKGKIAIAAGQSDDESD